MHTHKEQSAGRDVVLRQSPGMLPWLERLPELRRLTVADSAVRFTDKREWGINPRLFQRFDVDYTREDLKAFIRDCITPHLDGTGEADRLVINVRRGDYYSVPEFRAVYGMNIEGYIESALEKAGPAESVLVVSDDPAWCQEKLRVSGNVEYAEPGAWENFNAVATAHRLIGTNSSFSYWGGYVADTTNPGAQIIMPRFHKRSINGGNADQLDPSWHVINTVPGGWRELHGN